MADDSRRGRARRLRREATEAERLLWARLRSRRFRAVKFRRQHPMGPYIVDFVDQEHGLIVELDGGQHTEQQAYDERRTRWLESRGFTVLRFWNSEVLASLDSVLDAIWSEIEQRSADSP